MEASSLAASQMDGVRSLLNDLMQPPAGAAPVLNLGAMTKPPVGERAAPADTDASSTEDRLHPDTRSSSNFNREPARQDPARSLMGAIARGVLLQQQKQKQESQVLCSLTILLRPTSSRTTINQF